MTTQENKTDIYSVCRLCTNDGECVSLYDTSNFSNGIPLTEILFELSQVSITPEDGCPQHICKDKCLVRLLDFYLFKQQIILVENERRNCKTSVDMKIEIEFIADEDQYEAEFLIDDEDDCDQVEEDYKKSSDNFHLPPKDMIVTHLELENFDYIEYRGEKCCICGAFFTNCTELKNHTKEEHKTSTHTSQTEYLCSICAVQFENDVELQRHAERFSSKHIYLCKVCLQGFHEKNNFIRHMDAHQLIHIVDVVDDSKRRNIRKEVRKDNFASEPADLSTNDSQEIGTEDQMPSMNEKSYRLPPKLPDSSLISSKEDYEQHQIIYLDNAERCCGCGMFFESLENLQNHARLEHHIEEFAQLKDPYCEICHEKFKTPWALNAHKSHYRYVKKMYFCKLCETIYARKFHIIKHFQNTPGHMVDTGLLQNTGNVKNSERQTKNILGFSCCFLKCNINFENENMLLAHVEQFHAPRRKINLSERINEDHVCTICQRSFGSQQLLLLHRNRSLKKKHMCSYCAESFITPSTLREHELLVHSETIPKLPCDICDKTFRTKNLLKAHRSTHDQGKDFACQQCEAQFRFRFQLKKHVQGVHPTCFPYECTFCMKKFSTKAKHDLHLRSHTGEKPYKCRHESCGKQFSHVTDRKRHEMGVHTGERPYRCEKCSAAYIRKRELIIHMQKHPISLKQ